MCSVICLVLEVRSSSLRARRSHRKRANPLDQPANISHIILYYVTITDVPVDDCWPVGDFAKEHGQVDEAPRPRQWLATATRRQDSSLYSRDEQGSLTAKNDTCSNQFEKLYFFFAAFFGALALRRPSFSPLTRSLAATAWHSFDLDHMQHVRYLASL